MSVEPGKWLKSRYLPQVGIMILGIGIGLLGVMPSADHWTHLVYLTVKDVHLKDYFDFVVTPPPAVYHFIRPFGVFIVQLLFSFNAESLMPYVLHGITFPLFGLGAYSITRLYCGRRVAFLSAISAMSIPPTLFSGWLATEFDAFAGGILLFALAAYERFFSDLRILRRGVLALLLLVLTAISKETTAVFAMVFLSVATLHAFYRKEEKRYIRLLLFLLYCILVILVYFPVLSPPGGRRFLVSIASLPFLPLHNLTENMYLVSPMGSIALLLISLHRFIKGDKPRIAILYSWLPVGAFLLMAPITVIYSHYECVMISPRIYANTMALCLFLALVLFSLKPFTLETSYAKSIFYCIAVTTVAPFVLPSSRDEVSARVFIPFAPLLFSFIYKGIASLISELLSRHGVKRILLLSGCLIFVLNLAYYPLASVFNAASEYRTRIRTEYETKATLASELSDQSVVMFNNMEKFTAIEEFRHLWNEKLVDANFVLIPSMMMKGNEGKLVDQLCGVRNAFKNRDGPVFIYFLSPKSSLEESIGKWLVGDFNWVEDKTFMFLQVFPGWDFSMVENYLYTIYARETNLEKLINEIGGVYYEVKNPYVEIPLWINDVGRRLGGGIPLINKLYYKASLSRVDWNKLECPENIPLLFYITEKGPLASDGKSRLMEMAEYFED